MPVYDEVTVAYKDRRAVLDPAEAGQAKQGIFSPIIVVGGRVVGTWKRRLKKETVVLTGRLFKKLGASNVADAVLLAIRTGLR